MSYSTTCTDLHVLQYKLYKFTCLTVQAVQIYMSYSKFVQLLLWNMQFAQRVP
jgi:hypothetical protein